ncbi:FUSC family protein [Necropsobacter massiliensis]|uniref:FUSC family protein n=1 Tax=Necropsobacter massiliensis TaxID=1400001 RepID=UPI000595AA1A|nr:FUSC family protein [Necropsobacter massiliensis]
MSAYANKLKNFCGEIYWRETVLCAPAIIIVLAFSLDLDPTSAVVVVGAAFSVGFGASRTFAGYRWGAVIAATLGMALAAFVGSLASEHSIWLLPITALLTAVCALLTGYDNNLWWISLQIVVAFLVASYYPQSLDPALLRAELILLGGGIQLIGMMLLSALIPKSAQPLPVAAATSLSNGLLFRFMFCVVIAVISALLMAKAAGIANDYWAPMTALLILRPAGNVTLNRAINRLVGTLFGCGLATVIIYLFHDALFILLICLTLTAAAAFSMQKAHYALLSSMISATIVFLIALGFGDPIQTTEHRLIATLLGGATALVMGRIFRL